jgi:hypothetical protein
MENYSGLLPFLWRTFKSKPQEKKRAPEMQPSSMPHMILEDQEDVFFNQDEVYFLHPELVGKSPSSFAKSPGLFGKLPGRSSPGKIHRRRHSTGLSGFSLPKMLSSSSQRAQY